MENENSLNETQKDYMIRATADGGHVRAFAATTKAMVQKAHELHKTSRTATAALGRTLTAGAMMGAMMKGEKDVLTITFDGDGPIGKITVTAKSNGCVKGYVQHPEVQLAPNAKGKLDVGGAVGHGTLRIIMDIGLRDPYVGAVSIQSGEIADDLTYYYAVSEQTPSAVGLGVLLNPDDSVRESGGFIIQVMPDASEETVGQIEEKMKTVTSVTDLLKGGATPERILEQILGDMDLEILERMPTAFSCDCSTERVTKALIAIGKPEMEDMIAEGKPVTLTCAFCGRSYTFGIDELRAIAEGADRHSS